MGHALLAVLLSKIWLQKQKPLHTFFEFARDILLRRNKIIELPMADDEPNIYTRAKQTKSKTLSMAGLDARTRGQIRGQSVGSLYSFPAD